MRRFPKLAGLAEIAGLAGVSRTRAGQLASHPDFPEPVSRLAMGPVWREADVQKFLATERKPGRKPKCMEVTPVTTRRISDLIWTDTGDGWETCHAATQWILRKHLRRDGHVDRNGWYLHGADIDGPVEAGARIDYALKIATLLVRGEWDRTGLRELDGTRTWRNGTTGEVCREPDLLTSIVTAAIPDTATEG